MLLVYNDCELILIYLLSLYILLFILKINPERFYKYNINFASFKVIFWSTFQVFSKVEANPGCNYIGIFQPGAQQQQIA